MAASLETQNEKKKKMNIFLMIVHGLFVLSDGVSLAVRHHA